MSIQEIGICITVVVSVISLLVSLANYQKNKPKLKIEIADKKRDCFFGKTMHDGHLSIPHICGAHISIINNSPVAITISKATMIIGKERLRLINKQNDYWEEVEFYFEDNDKELTTDGTAIYYKETGLKVPFKLNAYDTVTAYALFHNFPAKIKGKCKGTIVFDTAIGKIKKKVTLVEYDKNYLDADYEDFLCYCRSLEETNQ